LSDLLRHAAWWCAPDLSRTCHQIRQLQGAPAAKSYDRATELEMAGATVLDLKPTEWRDLALAA
jgi:hypothetical protein